MRDQAELLRSSSLLNPQLVSLPRIQLLQVLHLYSDDGIEFRELQAQMGMSDGKLLANLYVLRDLGIIAEEKSTMESKTVTTYRITPEGQHEWNETKRWILGWLSTE